MTPRIIHIAGSKGKGTTAHLLAAILMHEGFRVGLFTSPWMLTREEMIQVNGVEIDAEQLEQILSSFDEGHSEFEDMTLAAFEYFRMQECDFWILECGWGGSIDATNWIDRKDLALLTHVELEHTEVLGETLEEIAREQLGIAKDGVPLITLPNQDAAVLKVLEDFDYEIAAQEHLGFHHPESAGLAIAAAEHFGIKVDGDLREKLSELVIPGRFERVELGEKILLLDGAHTPDSIQYFLERLSELVNKKSVHFAVHFLKDKHPKLWEFFPHERTSWIPLEDQRSGENLGGFEERSVKEALEMTELVVFVGSFKLVAEVKAMLQSLPRPA